MAYHPFIRSLLLVLLVIFVSAAAFSQVGISIRSDRLPCPCTSSPLPQEVICGRLATGPTTMTLAITTGSQARG